MKSDLFQSCAHCWVFQICWHIDCGTFTASSFRVWNNSAGIPLPPLALFVVILSKAHLTSHSRMSGSTWVTTPSWVSGSLRLFFLYSSSVYFCHLFLIFSVFVEKQVASLVAQRVKSLPAMQETWVWSQVGKIPWRRKWQPTPVLLPGKCHGWRCLGGYSPWDHQELDTAEQLHFSTVSALFCAHLCIKSSRDISSFLEEVFPILLFPSISLHCSFKKAFLSLLVILCDSAFSWVYLFLSPLPSTSLLTTQYISRMYSSLITQTLHLLSLTSSFLSPSSL